MGNSVSPYGFSASGRMVGSPTPSHLQHPHKKLNFIFEVGDAGLEGGDDLLEVFFIGADAEADIVSAIIVGKELVFIEVGQVVGLNAQNHRILLQPVKRNLYLSTLNAAENNLGHRASGRKIDA